MGTRHLVAVVKDGDFKVAQYGQWDGYPSGQGKTILAFLSQLQADGKMDAFHDAIDRCYFMGEAERKRINDEFGKQMAALDKHKSYEPAGRAAINAEYRREGSFTHLSRDVGGQILDVILQRPDAKLGLIDTRGFAGDSLFCEWAYVVDLDECSFEVYKGFSNEPTPPESRFPSGAAWLEKTDNYEPVKLVKTYHLRSLPTEEAFLAELEPLDEEDAA